MPSTQFRSLVSAYLIAVGVTALHDIVEFGAPSLQNTLSFVILVGALLLAYHQWPHWARCQLTTLLVIVLIWLVGGGIASIVPLSFWPWTPAQSALHYVVHTVWTISLGILAFSLVRSLSNRGAYG